MTALKPSLLSLKLGLELQDLLSSEEHTPLLLALRWLHFVPVVIVSPRQSLLVAFQYRQGCREVVLDVVADSLLPEDQGRGTSPLGQKRMLLDAKSLLSEIFKIAEQTSDVVLPAEDGTPSLGDS